MVELDKGEEEVQSQGIAETPNKSKEDHSHNTGQKDSSEPSHAQVKESVGDDEEVEEDLPANIKDLSKSGDL